jgi:hypothetical protein
MDTAADGTLSFGQRSFSGSPQVPSQFKLGQLHLFEEPIYGARY